jgi:hypothetical protein
VLKTNRMLPVKVVRFIKLFLILLAATIFSFIFLFPQLFYCEMIAFSGFEKIRNRIYVSPEVSSKEYKKLKILVAKSEMRLDSFYSGIKSKPRLIICSNAEQYQKYCSSGQGAGCSLGTPWGESYIILNSQGQNIDVISHEMSHIELIARLGWWKTTTEVPQWFNEGLALMLDKRFVSNSDPVSRYLDYCDEWLYYTKGGQVIRELEGLASLKDFFTGSQPDVMMAYMTSGMEVSYWLAAMKHNGFKEFLRLTDSGLSFTEAYRQAEKNNPEVFVEKLPVNPLRIDQLRKSSQ